MGVSIWLCLSWMDGGRLILCPSCFGSVGRSVGRPVDQSASTSSFHPLHDHHKPTTPKIQPTGVKTAVKPHEVLLVVDAMTGQEAATVTARFNDEIGLTGA